MSTRWAGIEKSRKSVVISLFVFSFGMLLLTGCASRKEVRQFQTDHTEFRGKLQGLDFQMEEQFDSLNLRIDDLDAKISRLESLLGGNVSDYLLAQEELLRAMRADQNAVSSELERLIVTLSSRVDESEERLQRLLMQLDTFNLLMVQVLGDSLASVGMDATEAQRLFQQSYGDYLKGETEIARMGFDLYVKEYPTTNMADDALYWVGETFLAEEQPDSARIAFMHLEDGYPESNRLATALLKRGIIRLDMGDISAAKRLFNRVINEFPDTEEKDLAELKLQQVPEENPLEEPPR